MLRSPWVPLALLATALGARFATSHAFVALDSYEVLDGTAVIEACLRETIFTSCGKGVNEFALLQYIPTLGFKLAGLSYEAATAGLVVFSGLAVLGSVSICWFVLIRMGAPLTGTLAAVTLVASPLLWHSNSAYGEALASVAVAAATATLLLGAPALLLATATAAAGITKETAPLFVALVALAAWRIRPPAPDRRTTSLLAFAAGSLIAVVLNAGFNVFRYGTPLNVDYTREELRVPFEEALRSFAALLVSPTGGTLWMWPLGIALTIAAAVWQFRGARGKRLRPLVASPAAVIALIWLGLLTSLSLWYSPLGGSSWGPRLLVPWLPALVLLPLAAHACRWETMLRRASARRGRVVAAVALVAVAGLPHLAVTIDSSRYVRPWPGTTGDRNEIAVRPYFGDTRCPIFPTIEDDPDYYWACLNHRLWEKGLAPADAYEELFRTRVVGLYGMIFVLTMAGVVVAAAASGRRMPQDPARA